jgi:hypothetical protein
MGLNFSRTNIFESVGVGSSKGCRLDGKDNSRSAVGELVSALVEIESIDRIVEFVSFFEVQF